MWNECFLGAARLHVLVEEHCDDPDKAPSHSLVTLRTRREAHASHGDLFTIFTNDYEAISLLEAVDYGAAFFPIGPDLFRVAVSLGVHNILGIG